MTEVQAQEPVLDFAASERAGRRNALPDILGSPAGVSPTDLPLILGSPAGVSPTDLPLKLAELNLKDGPGSGAQSPTTSTTAAEGPPGPPPPKTSDDATGS